MRSRYTAFTLGAVDYLLASWHPETRPGALDRDELAQRRWLGLKVRAVHGGGAEDEQGQVEFVARWKVGGRAQRLHEISRFVRVDGRWVYLAAEQHGDGG